MNNKNLAKGKATRFRTGDEQAKIARKGGTASGAARRENKRIRTLMRAALETIDESTGYTLKEKAVLSIVQAAANGDLRAFELVTKLIGDYSEKNDELWGEE